MTKNSTDYNNEFLKKVRQSSPCIQCLENLYLMIDNEATKDQEAFFNKHIEECIPCFDSYSLEKSVKDFLYHKLERKPVPPELVESIKSKIGLVI
jgi:anti-sigma factor (TIGR02949 family)